MHVFTGKVFEIIFLFQAHPKSAISSRKIIYASYYRHCTTLFFQTTLFESRVIISSIFYKRLPRRPPLRLVLSDGIGVTSSAKDENTMCWLFYGFKVRWTISICVDSKVLTNSSNLHSRSGKSPKCWLSTGSWSFGST